jgi:hypothetical protein
MLRIAATLLASLFLISASQTGFAGREAMAHFTKKPKENLAKATQGRPCPEEPWEYMRRQLVEGGRIPKVMDPCYPR